MSYLDENGLKILWNKIKDYAGKAGTSDGFQVTTNQIYTSGGLPQIYNKSVRASNTTSLGSNGIIMYSPTTKDDAFWIRNISKTAETEELEIASGDDGATDFNIYFRAYDTANNVAREVKVPTPSDSSTQTLALRKDLNSYAKLTALNNYPTFTYLSGNYAAKSSLASVATSGSYTDLLNKPTIPSLATYASKEWVTNQTYNGLDSTSITRPLSAYQGNLLNNKKADNFTVTNSLPTLSWGATSTIGYVKGTALQVKMPSNPNTDTHYTSSLYIKGNGTTATTFSQNSARTVNFVGSGGTTVSASSGTITITSEKPVAGSILTYTGYLSSFPSYVGYSHVHVLSASYVSSNVYRPLVFTQSDTSGKFTGYTNSYYNNGSTWSYINNPYCKIAYLKV